LRRPLLAVAAVALALAFFGLSGSALPRGGIILIHGADSGAHLRLSVSGGRLLVNGRLTEGRPSGCRLARGYGGASCRLAEASSVIVETGPANDKVEVLDPLPVPLTAYLGSGSDKFIGNAEADTCYMQGSARNRCLGGGGDDTCIAGPDNTDCIGGPGNDYCRMSNGSDGCWGGPGRDECLMGGGQDGCHGEGGDDRLFGGSGSDQLYGGDGFDYCDGGPGAGQSHECEAGARAESP
jgi:Ca2+-binding RTX toxin-like protein